MFVEQPRQQTQRLFEFAGANPLLKAAMTCLERRILLGQLAPLCPGTEHPKNAIQHGTGLVPRTSAVILATSRTKHRLNQHPLFFGQLPTSSHGRTRRSSEHFQNATDHSPWVFMRLVLGSRRYPLIRDGTANEWGTRLWHRVAAAPSARTMRGSLHCAVR